MTLPPDVKGVDPKTIYQRIKSEDIWEQLDFDPKYIPWLYINNIVTRVLSRVIGQGPYGPVPIKCSQDGSLFVAGLGGGYTRNEVNSGNVPDAYGASIAFTNPVGRVDLFVFDNALLFKRTRDDVVWDDEIELFKDAFYSYDCTTYKFNVRNKVAGATARYQAVGWF